MRRLSAGVIAIATILSITPLSLRWSHGNDISISTVVDSAAAADMDLPVRHQRHAYRHGYYAVASSRTYSLLCDGPYMGGGFNGGTYFGGAFMDRRCYGYGY